MIEFPVKNNAQIDAEAEEASRIAGQQDKPVILRLAEHVRKCFESAKTAKATVMSEMQQCVRMRRGEYDTDKLKAIEEAGGSTIYMRLVEEKCVAAESWLIDIIINQQDKPWGIKPTPVPYINPSVRSKIEYEMNARLQADIAAGIVTQEMLDEAVEGAGNLLLEALSKAAREAAANLEKDIEDILVEGGFYDALKGFIYDMTTYHCAFIKSPVIRIKPKLVWSNDGLVVKDALCIEFDRPSPFDIYPSPSSEKIGDGYLIEHHRLFRSDLQALIGVAGYSESAIRDVLKESATGYSNSWLIDSSANIENDKTDAVSSGISPESRIDALQYWGNISGRQLVEYGMSEDEIEDIDKDYTCEVWLVGNHVIKAALNPDKLGRFPYAKSSFRNRPGSFWGESLAWVLKDTQDMCNSAARNLVNNMAISSGPQVGVDVGSMPQGEDITKIYPWKIWQFNKPAGQPVWFFQPNSLTAELLNIYKFFSEEADNKSGIPKYSYGSGQTSGALSTATGFTMMLNNATRGIKAVVLNIDNVTEDVIKRLFQWKMIYSPFKGYKGDAQIVAKGSSSLVAKEQLQMRKQELLNIMLHPTVTGIIGTKGIVSLLRSVVQGADIDADGVVPTEEELARELKIMETAQQQQMPQPVPQSAEVNGAGQAVSGQEYGMYAGQRG